MSEFNSVEEQPVLSMDDDVAGYEVISSDEVDRTVAALEELMSRLQSENIQSILDVAADEIYSLVYSDSLAEAEAA